MTPADPHPVPDVPPAGADTVPAPPPFSEGRLWRRALLAAVAAALVSWVGGEVGYRKFRATYEDIPRQLQGRQSSATPHLRMLTRRAHVHKAMASYGLLGAALGMALGLAGGLASRSAGSAARAAAAGLLLGALAGALPPVALVPRYFRALDQATEVSETNDLARALLVHGAVWVAIGLAGGLALGLGTGGRGRPAAAALGGAVGGLVAALLYELVGAFAFPVDRTGLPVADVPALRTLAHLLPSLAVAACATIASTPGTPAATVPAAGGTPA